MSRTGLTLRFLIHLQPPTVVLTGPLRAAAMVGGLRCNVLAEGTE